MRKSKLGTVGIGKTEFVKDHPNVLKITVSDLYDIITTPLESLVGTRIFSIDLDEGSILYINTLHGDYKIEDTSMLPPFEGDPYDLVGSRVLSIEGSVVTTNKGTVKLNWGPLVRV